MTTNGKLNLLGILALPVVAAGSAMLVATLHDQPDWLAANTLQTVALLNLVPVLLGALVSWLLMRGRLLIAGLSLLVLAAGLVFAGSTGTPLTFLLGNLVAIAVGGLAAGRLFPTSVPVWPTVLPALGGVLWYLVRAVSPSEVAPEAQFLSGPMYLVMGVVWTGCLAWVACLVARRT
jgi:hypothetical protein